MALCSFVVAFAWVQVSIAIRGEGSGTHASAGARFLLTQQRSGSQEDEAEVLAEFKPVEAEDRETELEAAAKLFDEVLVATAPSGVATGAVKVNENATLAETLWSNVAESVHPDEMLIALKEHPLTDQQDQFFSKVLSTVKASDKNRSLSLVVPGKVQASKEDPKVLTTTKKTPELSKAEEDMWTTIVDEARSNTFTNASAGKDGNIKEASEHEAQGGTVTTATEPAEKEQTIWEDILNKVSAPVGRVLEHEVKGIKVMNATGSTGEEDKIWDDILNQVSAPKKAAKITNATESTTEEEKIRDYIAGDVTAPDGGNREHARTDNGEFWTEILDRVEAAKSVSSQASGDLAKWNQVVDDVATDSVDNKDQVVSEDAQKIDVKEKAAAILAKASQILEAAGLKGLKQSTDEGDVEANSMNSSFLPQPELCMVANLSTAAGPLLETYTKTCKTLTKFIAKIDATSSSDRTKVDTSRSAAAKMRMEITVLIHDLLRSEKVPTLKEWESLFHKQKRAMHAAEHAAKAEAGVKGCQATRRDLETLVVSMWINFFDGSTKLDVA